MKVALEVDHLCVYVGDSKLVGPISFTLMEGQSLIAMGETGAGKSLLAQAILGTLPEGLTTTGSIHLFGLQIDNLDMEERSVLWGKTMTMLPQEPWRALSPLKYASKHVREVYRRVTGYSRRQANEHTQKDFTELELEGAENKFPGELSGGMAQRVAFAAARAGGAPLLLADEPTKGLDADRRDTVVELLAEIPQKGGSLVAITHDVAVARRLNDFTIILKEGELVEQGLASAILNHPTADYTRDLLAADPNEWLEPENADIGKPVLTAKDIAVARGGKQLFDSFNLSLRAGERIAITGPSGCGKSSLLDVLTGVLAPISGEIERGMDVEPMGVQKLYQDPPAAFPKHIKLGRHLRDVAKKHKVDWARVLNLLERLKIGIELLERLPHSVSGGELQRIALVRALAVKPAVLLADEPTSRLDPITQRETMELIADETAQEGIAVLLVTHDKDIATRWAQSSITIA